MTATQFIGLSAFQWLALVVVYLTLLIIAEAFVGHYRRSFISRSQYAPLIGGGLLIATALVATVKPWSSATTLALQMAGWLAVIFGLVGFGFHHYYGIAKKPGGYKWLFHHLMYGAPPLAPLSLSVTGALALITARGFANQSNIGGVSLRTALLISIAIAMAGATVQAAILHYRGAFNNPIMFAPLTVPVPAIVLAILLIVRPNAVVIFLFTILLWLTFLIGFVGWGMHLRGYSRHMGGLFVTLFNLLEGPAVSAPALFTGFAAIGLITVYLL
ncbi:MAG: hypothetical protein ABR501_06905 [Pyrinomonadaceae bacterium]